MCWETWSDSFIPFRERSLSPLGVSLRNRSLLIEIGTMALSKTSTQTNKSQTPRPCNKKFVTPRRKQTHKIRLEEVYFVDRRSCD